MQTTKRILSSILAIVFMVAINAPEISAISGAVENDPALGGREGAIGNNNFEGVKAPPSEAELRLDDGFSEEHDTFLASPAAIAANLSVEDYEALQTAVTTAPNNTEYIIEIADNIIIDGTITIAAGKNIILRSANGAVFTLAKNTTGRHILVSGSLTLENIVLDGSTNGTRDTAVGGGVQISSSGALIMDDGAIIQNCLATSGGGVYLTGGALGLFTMKSGSLITDCFAGPNASNRGGGVYIASGTLTMQEGAAIQNCESGDAGGGIYMTGANSKFNMLGGSISGNKTTQWSSWTFIGGGGVYVAGSAKFYMTGGIITGNDVWGSNHGGGGVQVSGSTFGMSGDAEISGNFVSGQNGRGGGGIMVRSGATVNISGNARVSYNETTKSNISGGGISFFDPSPGTVNISENAEISGNTALSNGGDFYMPYGTLNMTGGMIDGNTAVNGGGIYVTGGSVNVSNAPIINNRASRSGGGIYTTLTDYSNITTADNTRFSGNAAAAAHTPPEDAVSLYPNIRFASATTAGHPLNNFDINYTVGAPVVYTLAYHANGAAGTPPSSVSSPAGTTVTVAGQNTLTMPGHLFTGWNTMADGSGAAYSLDDEITLYGNMTLYAQWERAVYTLTYHANGAAGAPPDNVSSPAGTAITVAGQNTLIMPDHLFTGWNTMADGSGAAYSPGDAITLYGSVTLYAQWERAVYTLTYDANGAAGTPPGSVDAPAGTAVTIAGQNTLIMPGHLFTGWNTMADGSGTTYSPGDAISLYGSVTLYAQWERAVYTLTYDANGAAGTSPDSVDSPAGTAITVDGPNTLTMAGHLFTGWNTMADGSGTDYLPGNTITLYGSTTLYAKWKRNILDSNDGGVTGEPVTPRPPTIPVPPDVGGEPVTPILPSPSKPGHTLVPNDDGTYTEINESGVPLGTWKLNEKNVWIFEELTPLSGNPTTGRSNSEVLAIGAMGMVLSGLYISLGGKKKDR